MKESGEELFEEIENVRVYQMEDPRPRHITYELVVKTIHELHKHWGIIGLYDKINSNQNNDSCIFFYFSKVEKDRALLFFESIKIKPTPISLPKLVALEFKFDQIENLPFLHQIPVGFGFFQRDDWSYILENNSLILRLVEWHLINEWGFKFKQRGSLPKPGSKTSTPFVVYSRNKKSIRIALDLIKKRYDITCETYANDHTTFAVLDLG